MGVDAGVINNQNQMQPHLSLDRWTYQLNRGSYMSAHVLLN